MVGWLWRAERDGEPVPDQQGLDEAQMNTVGYVLSRYGRLTGRDLETLSHGEEPWRSAAQHRRPGSSVRIEPRVMRSSSSQAEGDDETVVLDSAQVSAWLEGAQERRSSPSQPDDLAVLRARLGDA